VWGGMGGVVLRGESVGGGGGRGCVSRKSTCRKRENATGGNGALDNHRITRGEGARRGDKGEREGNDTIVQG